MAAMAANPFDEFDSPPMGFDDLIPKGGGTAVAEEDPFADLVPKKEEEDPFADLVPKEKPTPVATTASTSIPAVSTTATSSAPVKRAAGGLMEGAPELQYPEFAGTGTSQDLIAPSGLLESAVASGGKAALEQASGVTQHVAHLDKTSAEYAKEMDALVADTRAQQANLQKTIAARGYSTADEDQTLRTLGQKADVYEATKNTGLKTRYSPEFDAAKLARRKATTELGTQFADAAQKTFEYTGADPKSQNFLAQVGRGVGTVGEMYPAMVLGGLPSIATQGAAGAYGTAYDSAIKSGKSEEDAAKAGSAAAVKTAPGLALYMIGGKLAGEAGAALLKNATPAAKALVGAAFAGATNVGVGTTLRALEGGDWKPTIESLTVDGLFGIIHGYGEWKNASKEVQQHAAEELARRKADFQNANPDVSRKVFEGILSEMDEPTRLKVDALTARLNSGDELDPELQKLNADIQQKMNAGIVAEMTAKQSAATGNIPEAARRALQTATSGREPSQPSKAIEPQVLDGLVRSRDALVRAGADSADIADVNQQLSAFDPAAITAAEERAKQPPPPTAPAGAAAPPSAPGGPSTESATADSFKQAEAEKLKAASDLASTAAKNAEDAPLAAAEAAKLAADIAAKADQPPTTTENAPTQVSDESRGQQEHPGIPQGTDVSGDGTEVRKEDGQPPGGGGGTEPAAEVPAAEADSQSGILKNFTTKSEPYTAPKRAGEWKGHLVAVYEDAAKVPDVYPKFSPDEHIPAPSGKKIIGHLLVSEQSNGAHITPTYVSVHPNFRGKGIANAMYDMAEKDTGKPLKPSMFQTEYAKKLWERRKAMQADAEALGNARSEGSSPKIDTSKIEAHLGGELADEAPAEPPPAKPAASKPAPKPEPSEADKLAYGKIQGDLTGELADEEVPPERPALRIEKKGKKFQILNAADEVQGVYDSEANANKAMAKIGQRSTFGLPPSSSGHDIIDSIIEQGGMNISGLSKEEQSNLFPNKGIWRNTLINNDSRITPDEMANILGPSETDPHKVVHGDGDMRTMFDLINKAVGERGRNRDQGKAETANQKAAEKQARSFERAALTPKEGETATPVSDLKIGDEIEVAGEKVTVTDIDADTGEVTMKDGSKFGVQKVEDGKVIYGEHKAVETDPLSDWEDLATPEEAKAYADKNELTDPAEPPVESPSSSAEERAPEAQGPGSAAEPAAPGARAEAAPPKPVETPLEKARRVLAERRDDLLMARKDGDFELAASLSRVIPKLERDLVALEKTAEAPAAAAEPVELWQRTRDQVGNQLAKHREAVKDAVARKKPVPDDVLAEYAGSKWADDEIRRRGKVEKEAEPQSKNALDPAFSDVHEQAREAAIKDNPSSFSPTERTKTTQGPGQPGSEMRRQWDLAYKEQEAKQFQAQSENSKRAPSPLLSGEKEPAKELPKLPPGKESAELLQGENEVFNLVSETAADKAARLKREVADEKAKAEKDAAEAKALQEKQQTTLFGEEQKAAEKPKDKIEETLKKAIDDLKLKPGELLSDPLFIKSVGKPVLRAALQIVLAAYKAGKSVAQAIGEGMDYLRANVKDLDEEKAQEWIDQYRVTPETETPAEKAAPAPESGTKPPEETSAEKPSSEKPTPPENPAQPRVVALRKSFTDAQREKMGLPAWDKPAALTNQEAWDEGQRVLAENPKAGEQLVDEMRAKPRALNPYEKAILLHEEGVRDTEYHASIDAVNKATTEQEYLSAQVRLDAARDANQQFYDAARAAGRASGQSLQAHKMALDTETWTLARMEDAIQARKPFGEKLTAKERAEIKDLHEQLAAERERADKAEAAMKDIEVAKLLDKIAKDQRKQAKAEASEVKAAGGSFIDWVDAREKAAEARIAARRTKLFSTPDILNLAGAADHIIIGTAKVIKGLSKFPEWFASMKGVLGDEFEPHAQAIFDESKRRAKTDKRTFDEAPSKAPKAPKAEKPAAGEPKAPKTTEEILGSIKEGAEKPDQKTIYDLVKSKIEANPDVTLDKAKVAEIMQEVRDDLQPHFPDITEDEVRDAFSGHGKITYPSKEQVNVKMRELRGASDVISKIEEAARGEHPQKTGKQRDKPTQFQRDLTKELIRTMRENGVDTKALEGMIKTAHDARVTRLKNSIEDAKAQIAAGKRTPKTPGTPWTPEELTLRQELSGLHEKLDALLDEPDSDQLNRIMNRIEAVTDKLNTGNIEPKAKSQNVPTKAVSEALDRLRGLNEELSNRRKALREAQNPPKTDEEKQIAALERQEEKLTEQIRTGKIDKPGGTPTADPKAVAEAKARVAELRKQIVDMRQARRDALNPPKTEEEKTLAALEKRQRAAEEALRTGNLATKGGKPSVDTEKVTKAKADLKEVNKLLADARRKSAEGIQRELDRYKKMIDAKRAELQRKIATGDVSQPARNPLSPEKTAIAKPLKILQDKWEVMKRKQELKSQSLPQKILRWATYLGHEMLLLSPAVGVKLSSAAATTAGLVRPLEEIVGYGLGKALPFLGEKADVEIAPSLKSLAHHEAKAAAEAFMNVANDIGSTMKHGKSDFELEFGKEYSNEMVSYVGRFHGLFKTIPARQAFTATFLRLAEKYAARGMDITDPDVRFSIGTQALYKAIEAKFQDPNLAVGAFRDAIRYIDRKSPFAGAITKAVAHTEMPVMTVASNLTWRALENVYGLPVGSARIANMYLQNLAHNAFGKKGGNFAMKAMSDMSTEQADSIAKQLKRGTVGAAAFLLGAYLYQNLGGLHEKGEKEKAGDVKPEEVRPPESVRDAIRAIPLVGRPSGDIPKEFAHHPTFVDMQAGATMIRVAEAMRHHENKGIGEGLAAAAIDTAAESPFGSVVQEGARWIDPATRLGAEGNFARTFLGLTGPLAWLAKKQDIDPSTGEPVKRKAENLGEELKLAIPGMRQEVKPAKKHHAGSSLYR